MFTACLCCKCPALTLLYERCANADDITSSACCHCLCDLVQCGQADCTLILHKLLTIAATARCVYIRCISSGVSHVYQPHVLQLVSYVVSVLSTSDVAFC